MCHCTCHFCVIAHLSHVVTPVACLIAHLSPDCHMSAHLSLASDNTPVCHSCHLSVMVNTPVMYLTDSTSMNLCLCGVMYDTEPVDLWSTLVNQCVWCGLWYRAGGSLFHDPGRPRAYQSWWIRGAPSYTSVWSMNQCLCGVVRDTEPVDPWTLRWTGCTCMLTRRVPSPPVRSRCLEVWSAAWTNCCACSRRRRNVRLMSREVSRCLLTCLICFTLFISCVYLRSNSSMGLVGFFKRHFYTPEENKKNFLTELLKTKFEIETVAWPFTITASVWQCNSAECLERVRLSCWARCCLGKTVTWCLGNAKD